MPGGPPKPLWKHLTEGTFRAERHRDKLLTEPVPPEFERLAELYRAAITDRQRSAIGVDVEKEAKDRAVGRGPARVNIDLTPREVAS